MSGVSGLVSRSTPDAPLVDPNSFSNLSPTASYANDGGLNVSVAANSGRRDTVFIDPERSITPQQLELLALYASGYSYDEIAAAKFYTGEGVRTSCRRAVSRSGAKNVTHLCALLAEKGLIKRREGSENYEPVQDLRLVGEVE
jgi:DNA-binding CsgD family transcriptional regulator